LAVFYATGNGGPCSHFHVSAFCGFPTKVNPDKLKLLRWKKEEENIFREDEKLTNINYYLLFKYSQTRLQRPPSGTQNSGRC